MDEYVSALKITTKDDTVYYSLNVNFLETQIVFINCSNKRRMTVTFDQVSSIRQDRVRAEHLLS